MGDLSWRLQMEHLSRNREYITPLELYELMIEGNAYANKYTYVKTVHGSESDNPLIIIINVKTNIMLYPFYP